jgi:hypothetical protein
VPLPAAPSLSAPLQPAKLKLRRAGVREGSLDVLARITRDATGDVDVAYRARDRTLRFRADRARSNPVRAAPAAPPP